MEKKSLSLHILKALARHQMEGRRPTLQSIVDELNVRRGDIRQTISALHNEGYLDALRLRLTMAGFTVGAGLMGAKLPPLRASRSSLIAA